MLFLLLMSFTAALLLNTLIGCCMLAAVDDKNQSLLTWVRECPFGSGTAINLWPIIFYHSFNKERN
jgi:hypothetical protein